MTAPRFEKSDLPPRGIALALAGLLASLLIFMVIVAWFAFSIGARSGIVGPPGSVPAPAPRLLVDPPAERLALEAEQRRRITSQAKIPIDRAMRVLAQRGWGETDAAPGTEATALSHADAAGKP